ncbi:MAG: sel1 repeat family protein [Clostridiales bacterium]|nr:sel1 repeat family protein [Clostridiales bacterium]
MNSSITVGLLSALTAAQAGTALYIMFYTNLGLMLCVVIDLTAIIVLCKKTSCASVMGLATVIVYAFGLVVFVVQLALYVLGQSVTIYFVYICLATLGSGFIVGGIYCIMLSRNSHSALCIATGVFHLIPPVGCVLSARLSYRIHRDSTVEKLVYNGYAFTYAKLNSFCEHNTAEFADMSGEEDFENLSKKEIKAKLKALKAEAHNGPKEEFDYAAALMNYAPHKYKAALKLFERSAVEDYVPALFNLGYYHEKGVYTKLDIKKARAFYTRAAEKGDKDARLRLAIVNVEHDQIGEGLKIFRQEEESGNLCAKYNLGVCQERGIGNPEDIEKALEIYTECANAGLYVAQRRIFSLANKNISSPHNYAFFRFVTDRDFKGDFAVMIKGLIKIKKRLAADAADCFLKAVKMHGKWEGVARCLVGTLYIDCGKQLQDRVNGTEYIKSAFELSPNARDIYSVIPKSLKRQANKSKK